MIFLIIAIILVLAIVAANIKIVPQSKAYVIERLGAYQGTWETGFHIKIPFLERVARIVSLKEQVVDFAPQPVITKDNVTMQIDTVVFFQITDPKLYTYGVESPISAIENLSATTLRNIIGELELDSTLTSRDTINAKIRVILDEATDPWGIKVNRVELKNIIPPREIQDAMEKQFLPQRAKRQVRYLSQRDIKSRRSSTPRRKSRRQYSVQKRLRKQKCVRPRVKRKPYLPSEGQTQRLSSLSTRLIPVRRFLPLRVLKPLKRRPTERPQRLLYPLKFRV